MTDKETIEELKKEVLKLKNKTYNLEWQDVEEKLIRIINHSKIIYGNDVYTFKGTVIDGNTKRIKALINDEKILLTRQSDPYIYKSKMNEYLVFSGKVFTFLEKNKDEYLNELTEKGGDFQIGENNNRNYLIEGDNLFALETIKKTLNKKFDIISIDPPYNTGKDFTYNDKTINIKGDRHSAWLSFMKKRIELSYELMKTNSVMFLHIDEYEIDNISILLKQVFGEENLSTRIIWDKGNAQNDAEYIQKNHEYILVAIKGKPALKKTITEHKEVFIDQFGKYYSEGGGITTGGKGGTLNARVNLGYTIYYNPKTKDMKAFLDYDKEKALFGNNESDVYDKPTEEQNELLISGYVSVRPPKKDGGSTLGVWTWGLEKFLKEKDDLIIKYNKSRNSYSVRKKKYVDVLNVEKKGDKYYAMVESKQPLKSIIKIPSSEGAKDLKKIFNGKQFSNPKPIALMKELISSFQGDDIDVLDFFAGSGSSGHAVWDLNKSDNINRTFVLATNNENDICEKTTFERLKKANDIYQYCETMSYLKIIHNIKN